MEKGWAVYRRVCTFAGVYIRVNGAGHAVDFTIPV
jgi:hypothetical protein